MSRLQLMPSIVFLQLLNVIGLAIAHHPSTGYHLGPGEESHTTGGNKSGPLWPWQIFQSAPYNPPELEISSNGAPLGDGLLLFTPGNFRPDVPYAKQSSAVIMTDAGQLVWNGPTGGTNLRTAAYKGSPILTYWTGATTAGGNAGHGYGNVTLLNNKYEKIITVCPKLGLVVPKGDPVHPCEADLHEAFITDRDTLVISAYNATPADLSTVGGPKSGWVFDCLVVEIEPESGEILFRWSAFEHVPVSESQYPLLGAGNESVPFDYFHINSITTIGDSFLVNARHTWSTYLVSASGNVEWTLQGETGGDFGSLPEQGRFRWQHNAVPHNVIKSSITISYFNNFNAAPDNGTRPSSGLVLQLSLPPNKSNAPKVLQYFSDPSEPLYAASQGSAQILGNGNALLDYGQVPVIKEFGPGNPTVTSDVRWTARFGLDSKVQSYRAFKRKWHATPGSNPSLVVVVGRAGSSGSATTGYVSWNGATDVTAWEIWAGPSKNKLSKVGRVKYRGFETKFGVPGTCALAVALEGRKAVRKSNVACVDQ